MRQGACHTHASLRHVRGRQCCWKLGQAAGKGSCPVDGLEPRIPIMEHPSLRGVVPQPSCFVRVDGLLAEPQRRPAPRRLRDNRKGGQTRGTGRPCRTVCGGATLDQEPQALELAFGKFAVRAQTHSYATQLLQQGPVGKTGAD